MSEDTERYPRHVVASNWIELCSDLSRECSPVGMQNCFRARSFAPEVIRLAQRRRAERRQ